MRNTFYKKPYMVIALLLLMVHSFKLSAQLPVETPAQKKARLQWWTDARFGMFIHWGLYSLAARHEWVKNYERINDSTYQKYFDNYNPDLYNPEEWALKAKQAGMKYVVLTTKHHEGFCLWDSKYTDYKVTNTPYGKDLLKPFVEAFRRQGIRVGFYYSLIDWHHPDFTIDRVHPMRDNAAARKTNATRDMNKYRQYIKNQLTELLTNYGKIDELFLDFSYPGNDGKGHEDWDSENLLKLIRKLQPQIIVNDRLDLSNVPGGWDYQTPEQFMPQEWPTVNGVKVPWETCQTFSGSWGYYRDEYSWKSINQLVEMLIETTSKGGNLLLNVGPTARGVFDERADERLKGLGDWMKFNERSIYGCTQAPDSFAKPDNCLLTYNPKTNRLYIHVLQWPFKSLHLKGYAGKIRYAQLLNDASEVRFTTNTTPGSHTTENSGANDVILDLPVTKPNTVIPVIELILK
ncbi:alpha-L-fucosidase [Mucilaginibacter sp. RS28]|uniref:alpha-L-fucosidase n=1 Tax=Mucilaginibacter straminoryzae TaxID=2932774 RepID=A0A9X2B803_9SPHI|nr:alpha-L-fucosidase [Mucilaginibacter straminoryzae]MCJ8208951.1 alpha-L-fucosidase [Mucilaginibacter straminoryzae]